ncbi:hypothetical protein N2152v2_008315 [Parachlorella kessleri]
MDPTHTSPSPLPASAAADAEAPAPGLERKSGSAGAAARLLRSAGVPLAPHGTGTPHAGQSLGSPRQSARAGVEQSAGLTWQQRMLLGGDEGGAADSRGSSRNRLRGGRGGGRRGRPSRRREAEQPLWDGEPAEELQHLSLGDGRSGNHTAGLNWQQQEQHEQQVQQWAGPAAAGQGPGSRRPSRWSKQDGQQPPVPHQQRTARGAFTYEVQAPQHGHLSWQQQQLVGGAGGSVMPEEPAPRRQPRSGGGPSGSRQQLQQQQGRRQQRRRWEEEPEWLHDDSPAPALAAEQGQQQGVDLIAEGRLTVLPRSEAQHAQQPPTPSPAQPSLSLSSATTPSPPALVQLEEPRQQHQQEGEQGGDREGHDRRQGDEECREQLGSASPPAVDLGPAIPNDTAASSVEAGGSGVETGALAGSTQLLAQEVHPDTAGNDLSAVQASGPGPAALEPQDQPAPEQRQQDGHEEASEAVLGPISPMAGSFSSDSPHGRDSPASLGVLDTLDQPAVGEPEAGGQGCSGGASLSGSPREAVPVLDTSRPGSRGEGAPLAAEGVKAQEAGENAEQTQG